MGSIQPPPSPGTARPIGLASTTDPAGREPELQALVERLRGQLDSQSAALQAVISLIHELPLPCLVTDQAGRCLDGNPAFLRSLETNTLQLATGRVRFEDPALQQEWETALVETHVTGIGRNVQIALADGICWIVHLRPWQQLDALNPVNDPRLILAVFETKLPDLQAIADQAIVTARLTQAELQVLAGLLKGLPAKSIAGRRGASVNTVRSQIMAILEKTGFRSQKELMASFGNSSFSTSVDSQHPDSGASY